MEIKRYGLNCLPFLTCKIIVNVIIFRRPFIFDNQMLLNSNGDWKSKFVHYNSRNGAFKFIIFLSNDLTNLCP